MTESMGARVKSAVKDSNGNLTIEFAKKAIAQKEKEFNYWNNLPAWKQATRHSVLSLFYSLILLKL